jgi:hypothetical protein
MGIIIIFFIIDKLIFYKEGFSEDDKELMEQNVKNYPTTYSVDPLYTSSFKPECCPNSYTSSSGCLCINKANYSLVHTRGGNHYDYKYGSHPTPNTGSLIDTYS